MTDSRLAIVVLAAGQGTRMKSATPKLLHPLAGLPILSHVLATAAALNAAHVVTVVRHERDRLVEIVEADLPESIVVDQDEVPGTGRAVEQAILALPIDFEGDVLVVSGDVPLLNAATLASFITAHRERDVAATVLSAFPDDSTGYGRIVRDEAGAFDRIVEQKDASPEERLIGETNAGVYVFGIVELREQLARITTENAQGEKYLTDVIGLLRQSGSDVRAVPVADAWLVAGINDRAQLAESARQLNALIVRGWQLAGVTVQDPATTWIDLAVTIAPDVTIKPGTQILGATVIETGAVVGPDTTLVDCEIGANAEVKRTDATLAVIGAGASVGPFSYLRPGTILGADGKIGTFVETKNAVIGEGSKVPHLSYVGDATVGVHSNIGAGTIFANYNGVTKSPSVVGSHVRTGSHNVFVAPVRIGDGAYTGAGTIVRKDVPAGALALTVAPQRNMDGWVQTNRPGTDAAEAAAKSGD
ncbi:MULTISPECIES: bifunctional UDP-N-acetylglucosamine diphosphorylase/glucosamine-1-phosphate N-acetyltransferase GlmU [unclassified Cryobacterium]|uniref:bifunctional UDP-N-acetylglucosamine diphosphorylase/glucosamine-1-phosphate N-acetyltransferase GlmU n=1 Tax=unclassified Cryobacterium TaxID=2649013 RepID=UPI002AB3A79D|nr:MULTISPECIES: bifunctional UDP-N-acetylglucosamine diphosphorylase/glucosamine-1-phosphate N-acetyltransferase GlmU [unclassified Cryobacterium]MDY7543011.1 bifunctional UDP-N-acetylglucosamine diphosphorylase/glucosamine-1-phosphate N-acetyltransferase GlmU [Cryobacterium sp. 5B3]MEB0000384.1 bifunctional UDP-N-acetylglucosamine diphosphorylase/glucosamine-1-phosphate N-acetyltransferase GlmU [Cryobacterium sp. RTS3]MEB0266098.1 bifunctional UDP-N-acetylglucosamine diphosphorylase/glucosamin